MKLNFASLLLLAGAAFSTKAQVMLQEDFTSPFNSASAGWTRVNNSPSNGNFWTQGTGTLFPAFNGAASDYYAASYLSTTSSTATTISNWLITPTVTLKNGGVLQFASRTFTNPASFPDRLEVYMSTAGTGANVGTTPTSLGTFSTLLISINPSLTTTGYPDAWTVYTATVTGLGSPVTGRIGFRYYVTNAGPSAAAVNSFYIGLDAVRYWNPCGATVPSYTICSGGSATLAATGAITPATYTWSPAASNASSVVVNPGATQVYTLNYEENGSACPAVTSTVTIGSQLSVMVSASAGTVCAGSTVTLTANSAASNYSWSTGASAPVTTVAPQTTTTYSVGALNGFCFGGNTITINAVPLPTVSVVASQSLVCTTGASTSVNFAGNGANSYVWVLGSSAAAGNSITLNLNAPTPTATAIQTLGLIGVDVNGCVGTTIYSLTISPQPTLGVTSSTNVACTNKTVTLTATGANSFVWSGAATSTNSTLTFTTGAAAGSSVFVVNGTSAAGCTATASITQSIVVCNSNPVGIAEGTVYSATEVYPNPFVSEINVSNLYGTVKVFNAMGQELIVVQAEGNATINTADLTKGVYFVNTYNTAGELVKSSKLLKN